MFTITLITMKDIKQLQVIFVETFNDFELLLLLKYFINLICQRLLQVNNVKLEDVTHEDAVKLFRTLTGEIKLKVEIGARKRAMVYYDTHIICNCMN